MIKIQGERFVVSVDFITEGITEVQLGKRLGGRIWTVAIAHQ
jgi:hypothetical protein